ncbi:MAG: response regulator [Actinobacteria bacterium]|nr:MAG: response regulator [Actinomycetota bacterium]TMM14171.1 MAG: response regulator [Actinomycetota bacterium]
MRSATGEAPPVVLVADDDEDVLQLVAAVLEEEGYEIETARDGLEALDRLSTRRPDLALLDVRMPGVDGVELSRRIRRNPRTRDVPVILLSALVHAKYVARGFAAGATDYIRKPFSPNELIARVGATLDR